tara:strand:+ start:2109 stop:2297 length:189 start_codon:yes stop_codon:yes gene_type:complete
LDTLVLIGYIGLIAWIGSRFGKDQHNPEDYFLGGRKIPGWAIVPSPLSEHLAGASRAALNAW